ncbi:hypothetical protein ACJX0J_012033 [Zea mays]
MSCGTVQAVVTETMTKAQAAVSKRHVVKILWLNRFHIAQKDRYDYKLYNFKKIYKNQGYLGFEVVIQIKILIIYKIALVWFNLLLILTTFNSNLNSFKRIAHNLNFVIFSMMLELKHGGHEKITIDSKYKYAPSCIL